MESPNGSLRPAPPVNFGRAEARTPDMYGPRVQAALRGRTANEQRQILEELRKPKTGEELHALIQIDPTYRFSPDRPQEFLTYKAYKRERHTSMADDMAAAVDFAWGLTRSGVAGLVTDEEGELSYKGALKFLPSLLESTAQGTRDMIGMARHSEDPNSFVFQVSHSIWGDGSDLNSEIAHLNKALDFNEQTRRYQSGDDTMTLPAWMMDNRQVQALALFMDAPTAVGFVTPAGMAAKVAKVVGLERAAKALRGMRIADHALRAKVAVEKFGNAAIDLGLRGSSAAVKGVADIITNTVDAGINIGGKVIEFGTGLKADEVASAARKIGQVSPLALPLGYSIPVVSTTATAYMAASAARGMAEALDEIRKVMKRQAGQRSLVSFAQEALEDAAVSKIPLSPTTLRTLKFLNAVDPLITGSWTLAKATGKGMVVGGVLGFLNGGVQAIGHGAGTGGYLGYAGGTLGMGISEVLGASSRLRLENDAAITLQALKKTDPKLARELEIALGMPSAGLPEGMVNSNAHRDAILRFIVAQKHLLPVDRIGLEIVYDMRQNGADGTPDSLDKIVQRMKDEGYTLHDIGQYEALRQGAGLTFRSTTDNKIKVLLDANSFFQPGGELLLHEFTHGLGLNSRVKSWQGAAKVGVTLGAFRKETLPNGGTGYRLISRGMVSFADMRNHALAWVESSLRDGAITQEYADTVNSAYEKMQKAGNDSALLSQTEFDAVAKLADEFYTEYGGRRMGEVDPLYLRNGGRHTGLAAVANMLKERLSRSLANEINHSEPDMFFNRVHIGPDGKEYRDVNSGFVTDDGKLVRNAGLDAIFESTLRAASVTHERGVYDLSDLHPAIRDAVLFNLGLDSLMDRDQVGRVNKRRKGGKLPVDDKMALGPEAMKFLRSLPPGDRTSVDTIDGGINGPFSDKELGALVLRGYISEAFSDKIRMLQRMVNDPSSTKVIAFDYHGASMQRYVDSDNARLFGDDVPMTAREALIVDFDVEFDAKGNFVARIKALDLIVIDQRIKSIWHKPEVKSLWNNNYEEFRRDFFEKYLGNASKPSNDTTRVPSSELWLENGEAKRNVMHQVAGFAKADDLTWLNVPIAQIPRGTMMSMTDFTVGRMSLIQEQHRNEPIHYDNKNAFHDVSRNFRTKNWTEQITPAGRLWSNPLGYRILQMGDEYRVLHPAGTYIATAGDAEKATQIADDDFTQRANTMQQRTNAEILGVHDALTGKTLNTIVPESNRVTFSQLTLQTVAARMAANGATVNDIVEALADNGIPIQRMKDGSYMLGETRFRIAGQRINGPNGYDIFQATKPFDLAEIAKGRDDSSLVRQMMVNGQRSDVAYSFRQFLSDCYFEHVNERIKSGRGVVVDVYHSTFADPLFRENMPFDGGIGARKDSFAGIFQIPAHIYLASHPIGAGMALHKINPETLRTLDGFDKIAMESLLSYEGVTARPMILARAAFEKPYVFDITPKIEGMLFEEAAANPRVAALFEGGLSRKPFQGNRELMLPDMDRTTPAGVKNHDIVHRFAYGKVMAEALAAGHDGLVIRTAGKKGNVPYRSVDFIKLFPGENAYGLKDGIVTDDKIEILARTATVDTTSGKLVLAQEVSRMLDADPGRIGNLTGISAEELRSNPDLYVTETNTVGQAQARSVISESSGKLQFMHRPKSVTGLRVAKFTADPKIYKDWFARTNALLHGADRDSRPFPSVGVRDANDLRLLESRFNDVWRHAAEEFDRGTMTLDEFNSTLGEIRRQYMQRNRELALGKVINEDVFRVSSSLDDDFNLLKNNGSHLIGGAHQGYNGLMEIGPYHANDILDRTMHEYELPHPEGGEYTNEEIYGKIKLVKAGQAQRYASAIAEMASHFNNTAEGLVRLELVNRKLFAEGEAGGDVIPRWTFVWTEKATMIRDAYRAVIPADVWTSHMFDFPQAMRSAELKQRLMSNAEFMARQHEFKAILDRAFSAGNMLYRQEFGGRADRTSNAYDEHRNSSPENHDDYIARRKEERDMLRETTLKEVFESLKNSTEDGANRFPGPVGISLYDTHLNYLNSVEELNRLVNEAEALDAQQGGNSNIRALMAGYLNKAAGTYLSRNDADPSGVEAGDAVTTNRFYTQMMSMIDAHPVVELMKPLGMIEFLQKTQSEYDTIAYKDTFKSGLRTAAEAIMNSNPAGITAKNFRKEMEKIHSSGVPNLEEARVTGLLDYLTEKEKLPNLPNGKSPKLDYAELRQFLESTKLEVEMDPLAKLNTSGNGSSYVMNPTWYQTGYDIHVARVAPEKYYTSRHNGSQHVRKKGEGPGGSRAHDTILHQRFSFREFPQPDGSTKNALFLEESQANNDKRYQDAANTRLNYESAVYSAIDRSMETLRAIYGADKVGALPEVPTYDPKSRESIANYFATVIPTFMTGQTGVREVITNPTSLFTGVARAMVDGAVRSGMSEEGNPRFVSDDKIRTEMGMPAITSQEMQALRQAFRLTADLSMPVAKDWSDVAGQQIKNFGVHMRRYVDSMAGQRIHQGNTQTTTEGLNALKGRIRGLLRISKNIRPGHHLAPNEMKQILNGIIPNLASSGESFGHYSTNFVKMGALAVGLAKLMPKEGYDAIKNITLRFFENPEVKNQMSHDFAEQQVVRKDFFEILLADSVTVDGKTFRQHIEEIYERHITEPALVDGPLGPFGEQTKVYEIPLQAADYRDETANGYGYRAYGEGELKVRIPYIDRSTLSKLVMSAMDSIHRLPNTEAVYQRDTLNQGGFALARVLSDAIFDRKHALVYNELTDLVGQYNNANYLQFALGSRVDDLITHAKENGFKVGRNLASMKSTTSTYLRVGKMLRSMYENEKVGAANIGSSSGGRASLRSASHALMSAIRGDYEFQTSLGKSIDPDMLKGKHTHVGGEDAHAAQARLLRFQPKFYPLGVPERFTRNFSESYESVTTSYFSLVMARGDVMFERGLADPKEANVAFTRTIADVMPILQKHGWAKYNAVYDALKTKDLGTKNSPEIVMERSGLLDSPIGAFFKPPVEGVTHPADLAARNGEEPNSSTYIYTHVRTGNVISGLAETVDALRQGSMTPEQAAIGLKQALGGLYDPDVKKSDQTFSNIPFLESDDYFAIGFKMALREAFVRGVDQIVLIPALEGGSRSGLPNAKAHPIYTTLYPARAKKIMKAYKADDALKMPDMARVETEHPTKAEGQLYTEATQASANLNAAKKAALQMYKEKNGNTYVIAKPDVYIGSFLLRHGISIDGKKVDTFSGVRLPDFRQGSGHTISLLSGPDLSTRFKTSLEDAITLAGSGWQKLMDRNSNSVETGMMGSPDHRGGSHIPSDLPHMVREIFAANMYKATVDISKDRRLAPHVAADLAAQYCLKAYSPVIKSTFGVHAAEPASSGNSMGLYKVQADGLRELIKSGRALEQAIRSQDTSVLGPISEYLTLMNERTDADMGTLGYYAHREFTKSTPTANAVADGVKKSLDTIEAVLGEIEAHMEYYSSAKASTLRGTSMMTRGMVIDMKKAAHIRDKVMDGQFFYRTKGVKGGLKVGDRAWKTGFLSEASQAMSGLLRGIRMFYNTPEAENSVQNHHEVVLYPRGSENLAGDRREIRVVAMADPKASVAVTHVVSSDVGGKLAVLAMGELERRLNILGVRHVIGDNRNAVAFGRVDTQNVISHRPTSFRSVLSETANGRELTERLNTMGLSLMWGAVNKTADFDMTDLTDSNRLALQGPVKVMLALQKNNPTRATRGSSAENEKGRASYLQFEVKPDGTAEILPDMGGDFGGFKGMPKGWAEGIFDDPKAAESCFRMLMLAEAMSRLKELGVHEVKGFERYVLPNEDALWDDFEGTTFVPRSYEPAVERTDDLPVNRHDDQHPAVGEYLAYESAKPNRIKYEEFRGVVRDRNMDIREDNGDKRKEYTPSGYFHNYGGMFLNPRVNAKITDDVSYRPKRTWDMGKTGNYTTISSTDGYFLMLSKKGWKLFSPQRTMLGIYEEREEAFKRAERHSLKGK